MKFTPWHTTFFIVIVLLVVLLRTGTFIVYEGEQVVLTQFGKIVGETYTKPGVYFRAPLFQKTHYFEKRIQTFNNYDYDIITKEKFFINVHTVIHWRIDNAARFIEDMDTIKTAETRIENVVSGLLYDYVAIFDLVEFVRSKNLSNKTVNESSFTSPIFKDLSSEEVTIGENEMINKPIAFGRDFFMRKISSQAQAQLKNYGIDVLNVVIMKIYYNESVRQGVFERMILERERVSEEYISEGEQKFQEVEGRIEEMVHSILAPAIKESLEIRGKADAYAIKTFKKSLSKNQDFYKFWRSLHAYKNVMPNVEKVILSTDSPFFDILKGNKPPKNSNTLYKEQ